MEPNETNKPPPWLYLLMTAVYFGSFFGLKYGLLGGDMPWYYNILLIAGALLLAMALRRRGGSS